MYSVSLTYTHIYTHSTLGLAPTQETNFQFTVEWEISLPPASSISLSNLEGQGLDSSWGVCEFVRICVCMLVHSKERTTHTHNLKSKGGKKITMKGNRLVRQSESIVVNEIISEILFSSFLQ